jgi:hypothetical protein
MIIAKRIELEPNPDPVYSRAIARIERDLGYGNQQAHAALAQIAQAYGVFLDDVAQAVLGARSIKRGLALALRPVRFDRRR